MKETREERKKQIQVKRMTAIVLTVIVLLVCLVNLLPVNKTFSDNENRKLAEKPKFTWSKVISGQYMEEYESYRSDQFVGRNMLRTIKTASEFFAGKRESSGVLKGDNGYLMEEIAPMDEGKVTANLKAMNQFSESHPDIPMYMMLVPNAANILSDRLPALAETEDQKKQFQEIQGNLGTMITWVDVQNTLKSHKKEVLYYHTDSHWTTLGAYYAYQTLTEVMNLDTSKAPKMKQYAVNTDFNGDLSSLSGYDTGFREPVYIYSAENTKENISVVAEYDGTKKATLYDEYKLEEKDKYALFLGGDHDVTDIRTNAEGTDRLLVIKDSYANCMLPFLTPYYREIIAVDPAEYKGNVETILEENAITSVLFLYNGNTFVQDDNISGVLGNDETE